MHHPPHEQPSSISASSSPKRTFLLRKIKDPLHITTLQTQINQTFLDKNLYLNPSSPFHINKLPLSKSPPPNLKSLPTQSLSLHPSNTQRRSHRMPTSSSVMNIFSNDSLAVRKKQLEYRIVDDVLLRNYYNEYRTLEKKNKCKNNEMVFVHLPFNIKKKLLAQERKLHFKEKDDHHMHKLTNFLCKRTHKSIKDLLIHQSASYQCKRQAQNAFAQSKVSHGAFSSERKWIHSLRLSEGNVNKFVNIRSQVNPLWVVDGVHAKDEINRKPRMVSNECYVKYVKRPLLQREVALNGKVRRMEGLNALEVKGESLLRVESENENLFPGKKILYNKGQLDMLTMKSNNQFDFDKEFTNMMNDKLIVKKYS